VQNQWNSGGKLVGRGKKLARNGIYLVAAPKNAERVGLYTALSPFRTVDENVITSRFIYDIPQFVAIVAQLN
jgi:hypothetical protein